MNNCKDGLIKIASFIPSSLEDPNYWCGHLPFAAWLIQELKPKIFVELGTHSGNSYFSFCQSIREVNLATKCYAVDTWQGDLHTGKYGDKVFYQVNELNNLCYSRFSRLMRMKFDDAVDYFSDGSIDLLHIDGLHTYEAVKHDFETWLPKLAPGAVVLFHDTTVRDHGFGVWKLWEELQARYKNNLEFNHSQGLGVLQIDGAPQAKELLWLDSTSFEQQQLKDYFFALGTRQLERFELGQMKIHVANLNQAMAERQEQVASLERAMAERQEQVVSLERAMAERQEQVVSLERAMAERQEQVVSLERAMANCNQHLRFVMAESEEIRSSTSWKVTFLLRLIGHQVKRVQQIFRLAPDILRHCGGWNGTTKKFFYIFHNKGVAGIRQWLRDFVKHASSEIETFEYPMGGESILPIGMNVVPYYLNPYYQMCPEEIKTNISIGIHVHLFYTELQDTFIAYLNNIPVMFDLFVSIPEHVNKKSVQERFKNAVKNARRVTVEAVPNRGRDIAPLIVQFGKRLLDYEIICHLHTKMSPHSSGLESWLEEILNLLLGKPGSQGTEVAQILNILIKDAKVVYPEPNLSIILDRTGWFGNYQLAKELLEKLTDHRIEEFPSVEFPQGSMFWAKADALKKFLSLPVTYQDFPKEPMPPDGTIAHALERLILALAQDSPGRFYRIQHHDSITDFREYEDEQDFSDRIKNQSVKVLSYYLPQFHPIPENDDWHGKGFTEWNKVRTANPLFAGHYQQHIPHKDIGYYLLDSSDTLSMQANLMKRSGVYGQIFYHYWFNGKLILEEPAQLLLQHADIAMPFCFCWANENWTRRWDGNENDILLGQNYSTEDATAFIQYLIPFFRDSRYIKVEDRPVLFIYRPSSIPDANLYLNAWKQECHKNGLPAPYVVAVLTRGAVNPIDFGMDAGVERVLNDWTEGAVKNIKDDLDAYYPINGSVLDYNQVAEFYMSQNESKLFTYFRSVVPIWDNTARYGSDAFLLHGSTPEKFQEWMERLIDYSESTLPEDRQFIVVNAWNEWAEGAHLEPDTRYGYAYLNSIGRALAEIPYKNQEYLKQEIPKTLRVKITFVDHIKDQLTRESEERRKFLSCLARSSLFKICYVEIDDQTIAHEIATINEYTVTGHSEAQKFDYVLSISRLGVFSTDALEQMVKMACTYPTSIVVSNNYGAGDETFEVKDNFSVNALREHGTLFMLTPLNGWVNFKLCPVAQVFVMQDESQTDTTLPRVTTIIRFHKNAQFAQLQNALLSLLAMRGCVVQPYIAAQDLSEQQKQTLSDLLDSCPWHKTCLPIVCHYVSENGLGDLRARMMNESLQFVKTQYAAFLDYDDLMLPLSYEWLIGRLKKTGKAIAFGRVFTAEYDNALQRIVERKRTFEYGETYTCFLDMNHAPIHSMMFDIDKLDLTGVEYYDDQTYMEDYFLTLQIITENNADWDGLKENYYVGDYVHSLDRSHTLAFNCEREKQAVLSDPHYILCEQRVCELRKKISCKTGKVGEALSKFVMPTNSVSCK